MKKALLSFCIGFLLTACIGITGDYFLNSPKTITALTYVVFYPNYNDTVTVSTDRHYEWGSNRGTNWINEVSHGSFFPVTIYSGSAPYKILSYTHRTKSK